MLTEDLSLSVRFDRDDPHYRSGESVTGTVLVEVEEDCRCNELSVRLNWYADPSPKEVVLGSGGARVTRDDMSANVLARDLEEVVFSEGEWRAGETHEFEFSVDVPPGPYSYDGEIIEVGWELVVDADIPWNVDSSIRRELRVEPGGAEDHLYTDLGSIIGHAGFDDSDAPEHVRKWLEEEGAGVAEEARTKMNHGCQVVFAVIAIVAVGIPLLYFGLQTGIGELIRDEPYSVDTLVISAGALAIGGGCTAFAGWRIYSILEAWLAEAALGEIELTLDSDTVHPGETIRAEIDVHPERDATVTGVAFELVGRELITESHRTDDDRQKETHSAVVFEETNRPAANLERELAEGGRSTYSQEFRIPDDAPYSLQLGKVRLLWQVRARLSTADGWDWEDTGTLVVRAEPGGADVVW